MEQNFWNPERTYSRIYSHRPGDNVQRRVHRKTTIGIYWMISYVPRLKQLKDNKISLLTKNFLITFRDGKSKDRKVIRRGIER